MSFHVQYPRVLDERRPGQFKPATPKFNVRWNHPVTTLTADYLAVQHDSAEDDVARTWFERLRAAFEDHWGPESSEEMRYVDEAGKANSIVIGYWTDPTRHALWRVTQPFNAWFASANRESDPVGYWRETLAVPYDRFETIFSEPYYRAGWARTEDCELEPMYTAGYFGAMRDRIPLSAIDALASPYGEAVPTPAALPMNSKRVYVTPPLNTVCIRSGQYWQHAKHDQLDDYLQNLQPKLDVGMAYLQEHRETTGCLSLRAMVNLDADGNELQETSKHGYFLCLAQLEAWAAGHKSHLDIFKHALAMRRIHGADRSVVTWHEVSILAANPPFEYLNCHPMTGLLRFVAVWGFAAAPVQAVTA